MYILTGEVTRRQQKHLQTEEPNVEAVQRFKQFLLFNKRILATFDFNAILEKLNSWGYHDITRDKSWNDYIRNAKHNMSTFADMLQVMVEIDPNFHLDCRSVSPNARARVSGKEVKITVIEFPNMQMIIPPGATFRGPLFRCIRAASQSTG